MLRWSSDFYNKFIMFIYKFHLPISYNIGII